MPDRTRPAVSLGGGVVSLAVARSLGKAGIPVYVLDDGAWDRVHRSRYCFSFTHVPGGNGVVERWLEWLERARLGAVVLPCADDALELIARHRKQLLDLGYLPIEAADDVALAMLDKERTYELARALGVPTPTTYTVRRPTDIDAAIDVVGLPCVLKPLHSHLSARHFSLRKKAWRVHDRVEFEATLRQLLARDLDMLATEEIPGADDQFSSYYGYLDADGDSLLHFTKRKLRQDPPSFGLGSYHVTRWDSETAALGLRFFRGIGLRGLACVEFKRDARDGALKLIECNHRFTAATELATRAGADLPLFVYSRLVGLPLPRVAPFREGVHLWFTLSDTRAFLAYRRDGDLTLAQWTRSLLRRQHFPVFRIDDPLPSLVDWTRLVRRIGHRARQAVRSATRARPAPVTSDVREGD